MLGVLILVEEAVFFVELGAVIVLAAVVVLLLVVMAVTWSFMLAELVVAVDCYILFYKLIFSIYNISKNILSIELFLGLRQLLRIWTWLRK